MTWHTIPSVCGKCGETYHAGHICFPHNAECDLRRQRDIHDTCDALSELAVPPDVIGPIRAYADSLGECTCV